MVRNYQTNYSATMPDITIHMNCDTVLAVNLHALKLGRNDEFVFAIKNYNYINSPYVYIFKAKCIDMNRDGEVIFKIPAVTSKHLKHGAFYTMAVLVDALDPKQETVYKKLTDNGKILIDYGAQNMIIGDPDLTDDYEILSMKLERVSDDTEFTSSAITNEIVGMSLELIEAL